VEAPDERGTWLDIIELADRALATSGGYGEVFQPGRRHHLLDARTGLSRHEWASVTVIAEHAATADALSTCLAVLDPAQAATVLARFPGVAAYVVRPGARRLEHLA
jgi:thiamine biosynthesis lipoprotein